MNSSLAQKLKEKQLQRSQQAESMRQRAIQKAAFEERFERERQKKLQEAQLLIAEREKEKAEKERIRREREIEFKTKRYFQVNQFNRKAMVDGLPVYFGDFTGTASGSAWIPNGKGEFHFDGSTHFEGNFRNGLLNGSGKYNFFRDGAVMYSGDFKEGDLHGQGMLIESTSGRSEVLIRHNRTLCSRSGCHCLCSVTLTDRHALL